MRRTMWYGLFVALIVAGPFLLGAGDGDDPADTPIDVYYLRQAGAIQSDDPVLQALTLTDRLQVVDNLEQAQAIVVYNARPSLQEISAVRDRGLGMVLFIGPQLDSQLVALADLGLGWGGGWGADDISIKPVPDLHDPLLEQIAWTSAPQVKGRSLVAGDMDALVHTEESHEIILGQIAVGQGTVTVLTPWATYDEAHNPDLLEWPYWNYLVYHLAARAAGEPPLSYADYPGSPVPHAPQKAALMAALGVMLVGTGGGLLLDAALQCKTPRGPQSHRLRRPSLRQTATKRMGTSGLSPPAGRLFVPGCRGAGVVHRHYDLSRTRALWRAAQIGPGAGRVVDRHHLFQHLLAAL